MHRAQGRHGEHVKIRRTCPQASNMSTDDRYGLNGWARHAHISRTFGGAIIPVDQMRNFLRFFQLS